MTDIVYRLRNPPFGTETSERNLMDAAADEIEQLRRSLTDTSKLEYARGKEIERLNEELKKTGERATYWQLMAERKPK